MPKINSLTSSCSVNAFSFVFSQIAILRKLSVLLCLAFTSCLAPDISNWPDNIPPQRSFDAAYLEDAQNQQLQSQQEYLEWVLSFYQGNLAYPTGWMDVEAVVLNSVLRDESTPLAMQLSELGVSIGA